MKLSAGILAGFLASLPMISYFRYERQIQPANSGGQHYAVVDEAIWSHARPNLGDLRLYATGKEIPFALTLEMGNSKSEQKTLRILQPATVLGKTQFLLDMTDAPEYDRVQLNLATKNFVARALIEGQDGPHGNQWAELGKTTLYDLTDEKLGHNSTLQIPLSTYRFLRVTVDAAVKPSEVDKCNRGNYTRRKGAMAERGGQVGR